MATSKCLDYAFCARANGVCTPEKILKCIPGIKDGSPDSLLFVFLLRELLEEGKFSYEDSMVETIFEIYQRYGGKRRREVEDSAVISFSVRTDRGLARKIHLGNA